MTSVPPAGRGSRFNPYLKDDLKEIGKGKRLKGSATKEPGTSDIVLETAVDLTSEEDESNNMEKERSNKETDLVLGIDKTSDREISDIIGIPITAMESFVQSSDKEQVGEERYKEVHTRMECDDTVGSKQTEDRSNNKNSGKSDKQDTISYNIESASTTGINLNQEKYVVVDGNLKPMNDINKTEYEKLIKALSNRIDKTIKGECKIKCKIEKEYCTPNRGKNCVKISLWCNQNRVCPTSINMIKYNIAILTFKTASEANACLDRIDNLSNKWILGFIDFSDLFYRGVITDWPYEISELWENIVDKQEIFKIEKMKRRVWDSDSKKHLWKFTDNLLVTMKYKGNTGRIRDSITICDRLHIGLKLRPYVEPVRQCFNCFQFGHFKAFCRNKTKCITCGDNRHGDCHKSTVCSNCEGDHRPTYKKAARMITDSCTDSKTITYDRYTNPAAWPSMVDNNMNKGTEVKIYDRASSSTENTFPVKWSKTVRQNIGNVREIKKDGHSRKEYNRNNSTTPSFQETQRQTRIDKEKIEGQKRRQEYVNYYKQFKNNTVEISKEKRGIALGRTNEIETRKENNSGYDNEETTSVWSSNFDWSLQIARDKCLVSHEFRKDFLELLKKYSTNSPPEGDNYEEDQTHLVNKMSKDLDRCHEDLERAKRISMDAKRGFRMRQSERESNWSDL
ncbi:uncharacterized protein LOC120356765 [Solenopsis invicta]|uniref:uncharacterized protein LOC120356765 n=1 Tax=Solenopsis invicta TaxID=13686 RepID=UPI00193E2C22|nr:uncharacterized protein LOC120356765 [Solenopsis invicta]